MPISGSEHVERTLGDLQGPARERELEEERREDEYWRQIGDEVEKHPLGPKKLQKGFGSGDLND